MVKWYNYIYKKYFVNVYKYIINFHICYFFYKNSKECILKRLQFFTN